MAVADTIVVLPVARFVRERPDGAVLEALAAAAARGTRIVSLCLGAFVLAAAGLLDGRRATTHWPYCAALAEAYPQISVVPDVLYIDEGSVLTSGGVAAGIDLCLHLVRNDHGAEVANRLARALVVGPHREGGQAQFVEQPVLQTDDHRLAPVTGWALEHLTENLTIDQLAGAAAMSRRTFYREFRASTGTTPYHWLLAQRLLLARRLLETTQLTIEEVAQQSGFGDASRLRKHFTAQVRLTPTAYRRTFGHPVKAPPVPGPGGLIHAPRQVDQRLHRDHHPEAARAGSGSPAPVRRLPMAEFPGVTTLCHGLLHGYRNCSPARAGR